MSNAFEAVGMHEIFIITSILSAFIIVPGTVLLYRTEPGRPTKAAALGVMFAILYAYVITDPLGLIQSFYGPATWIAGMILFSIVLLPILAVGTMNLVFLARDLHYSLQNLSRELPRPRRYTYMRFDKQTGELDDI
jgi:hypothetical protein